MDKVLLFVALVSFVAAIVSGSILLPDSFWKQSWWARYKKSEKVAGLVLAGLTFSILFYAVVLPGVLAWMFPFFVGIILWGL